MIYIVFEKLGCGNMKICLSITRDYVGLVINTSWLCLIECQLSVVVSVVTACDPFSFSVFPSLSLQAPIPSSQPPHLISISNVQPSIPARIRAYSAPAAFPCLWGWQLAAYPRSDVTDYIPGGE